MSEPIQKHQLLVKLLKMTTSQNDGEALTAIRKANDLLASAGWDWDRLMAGKITVVGDPFANLGDPTPQVKAQANSGMQYAGTQTGRWSSNPQPTPAPPQTFSLPVGSSIPNRYEGHCYCCGRLVAAWGGYLFDPSKYHTRAQSKMTVICTSDNNSKTVSIGPSPAPRKGVGARKVTADDLS